MWEGCDRGSAKYDNYDKKFSLYILIFCQNLIKIINYKNNKLHKIQDWVYL